MMLEVCTYIISSCVLGALLLDQCFLIISLFPPIALHYLFTDIKKYLIEVQGFQESEMLILMDDNRHHPPTRRNIEDAFHRICQYSQSGDVVFIHYSGHGGRVRDTNGDEESGYDSTLIPLDFKSAGQIIDDDILKILVKPMKAGVNVTVLVRGAVGKDGRLPDSSCLFLLPYRWTAVTREQSWTCPIASVRMILRCVWIVSAWIIFWENWMWERWCVVPCWCVHSWTCWARKSRALYHFFRVVIFQKTIHFAHS